MAGILKKIQELDKKVTEYLGNFSFSATEAYVNAVKSAGVDSPAKLARDKLVGVGQKVWKAIASTYQSLLGLEASNILGEERLAEILEQDSNVPKTEFLNAFVSNPQPETVTALATQIREGLSGSLGMNRYIPRLVGEDVSGVAQELAQELGRAGYRINPGKVRDIRQIPGLYGALKGARTLGTEKNKLEKMLADIN